jgi:hypothetical protein
VVAAVVEKTRGVQRPAARSGLGAVRGAARLHRAEAQDGVRSPRLFLRRQVPVSYMTLYRFAVDELSFGESAPTIRVADCDPGQKLQLDTGWVDLDWPGDGSVWRQASAQGLDLHRRALTPPLRLRGAAGDDGDRGM